MSFNEEKCKAINFGVCRRNVLDTAFIEDNDSIARLEFSMVDHNKQRIIIKDSKQERDLGLIINHKLKWNEQIANCKKKLMHRLVC